MRGPLQRPVLRVGRVLRSHGLWLTALLTVIVFGGLLLVGDAEAVTQSITSVDPGVVLAAIGLVLVSYVVRFLKWAFYLDRLDVQIPLHSSLLTFFAGFTFVVTPGKVGEVWKAFFLRDLEGVAASRTTAVVGAERVTDLLALTGLASLGVVLYGRSPLLLLGVAAFFGGILLVIQWRTLCLALLERAATLPVIGDHAESLEAFYADSYALFQAGPLGVAMVISIVAWGLEGAALWLILGDLGPTTEPVVGLYVFGLGSIVGAVSLLPGGLAATEASMMGVLVSLGFDRSVAASATLIIRACTLWFGAGLGAAVLAGHQYRQWRASPEDSDGRSDPE